MGPSEEETACSSSGLRNEVLRGVRALAKKGKALLTINKSKGGESG